VLVNLLHNADDAIAQLEKKWIRICVSQQKNFVEIKVIDSGAGISAAVNQKLFQPFFTTKAIGKGTGMGLSISLGIMRAHGGECFVDSTCPNTCFVLRLPQKQILTAAA
jgi:C4-dicarboxylate-specific signal transduction histidine kinase